VSNLLVVGCTWSNTQYGIKIKTDRGQGGTMQDLTYRDLTMSNVSFAIAFYMHYDQIQSPSSINVTPFVASTDLVQFVTGTTPYFRNITISNLTATGLGGNIAGIIWGLPESLVSNVTLRNVSISPSTKTFCVYHAKGIQILDSNLTAPNTSTNTLTMYNAQVTVTNSAGSTSTNLVTLTGLAKPPTNNSMAFFNRRATITETNMLGTGPITLGGSTLSFSQTAVISSNTPISVVSASTLTPFRGTNTFSGALSGPGPLTLNLTNVNIMLTLQGDCSGFTGTLAITNNGTLRFDQGANTWGDANGAFDAGASGTINNRSTNSSINIFLGALSGSSGSTLRGSDQTGPGVDTYVIGGLNSNTTFAGTITNGTSASTPHTVALTKIDSGSFTLTGTNSYSGGTTVSNGTLLVNNTGSSSATGTGAVTVVNGATLSGSGIIGGPVTVNGTLAPGNGVGTLAISNNLVVNGGAVLQYALGTTSDLTVVSGNLNLGGTLDVTDAGGFTNGTYLLFSYGGGLICTNLSLGFIPPGFSGAINTNTSGQVNLVVTPYVSPYDAWQLQYFNCTNCAQGAASADPDGDGQNNLTEFLVGVDPTNGASTWGIQASPTIGLVPVLVNFSENSTGASITNRLWDFGDGSVGSGSNPSHTYTNAGTFSVGLTIFNVNGTASLVATNLITVAPFGIWTNANASGNWSDATSWDPSVIPDSGASVVFADAGATAVVNNVSRNVGNVTFDAAGGFTVTASGGAGLTISNGIAVTTNFSYTLAAPVVLGGDNLWSVSSNGSLQVSGPVSGTNSIIQDGGGTLILSGTNSYSGGTTVSNGTLQVSGDGQITNSPVITLAGGAMLDVSGHTGGSMTLLSGQSLMGNGTIRGDLIFADGATLSPGSSVGTLTFLNDLVLSNAAVLQYGLGAVSDLSVVSSNLTLGGTLNINDMSGFTTGVYTLVTYGGALTYNGVSIGTVPPGLAYMIDTSTAGQVNLIVAPQPSTVIVDAGLLYDRFGTANADLMPVNRVAVLVADTGNNGFADPQPGFPLNLGAMWGADDKIVGLWDLTNCGGCGDGVLYDLTVVGYTNGIAPGQKLQLYWFPSLTLASNTVGVTYYGKYTDANSPPLDGSDVWEMPAGGTTINLRFWTGFFGGSNPEPAGQATLSTAGTAPLASFTASPANGIAPLAVTFTDTSSGSLPLSLSWDLGDTTTTNTAGGASFTHTYPVGTYTVTLTASNYVSTSTLVSNNLITVVTALQAWQMQYFGCTNCPQAAPDADPLGKGISNTNQFLLGLNPTSAAAYPHVIKIAKSGPDMNITYLGADGDNMWSPGIASRTNVLEFTHGSGSGYNGNYSNNFVSVTGGTNILSGGSGTGTVVTVTDTGAATGTSRYYRIRIIAP
jgi:autotransporter-associated beta strand protein